MISVFWYLSKFWHEYMIMCNDFTVTVEPCLNNSAIIRLFVESLVIVQCAHL